MKKLNLNQKLKKSSEKIIKKPQPFSIKSEIINGKKYIIQRRHGRFESKVKVTKNINLKYALENYKAHGDIDPDKKRIVLTNLQQIYSKKYNPKKDSLYQTAITIKIGNAVYYGTSSLTTGSKEDHRFNALRNALGQRYGNSAYDCEDEAELSQRFKYKVVSQEYIYYRRK